jgi:hypothetical protein
MTTLNIKYDNETDLWWIAVQIDRLANAGSRLTELDNDPELQCLFDQIHALASPLYDRLGEMQKEREAAA